MLINRSDVDELYQAMDIFVMPSIFEGLPVVLIEAQANGLPCLISTNISNEVMVTSNVSNMSLKKSAEEWAKNILNKDLNRNPYAKQRMTDAGYDIKTEAKKLQDWYIELYENAKKSM